MSEQGPVLDVRDLRVWYGTGGDPVRAVDGVSFEINRGETVGLVGESGCGKSTLGRGILGLLPKNASVAGEVLYQGRNLVGLDADELRDLRGPDLGLIFQEPMTRLDPLHTIESHFLETLRTHRPDMDKDEMRKRALETLARMGIPPTRFKQYPHEFSGGMRQRIMIALALVLEPSLLIADEPTTALDVIVEAQILGILADLRENFDTGLLLITHNLGIVAEACDRVAVMYAGRIAEEGDAREVFSEPAHPYTRELLRSTISLRTTGLNYIPGAPPEPDRPAARAAAFTRAARTRCGSARSASPRRSAPRAASASPAGCTGPRTRSRRAAPSRSSAARSRSRRRRDGSQTQSRTTNDDRRRRPLIEVRDLHTHYSVRGSFVDRLRGRESGSVAAVDGVSFDLRRGEVLGLVGESGSGKTTLGRTLLGLVEATSGSDRARGRGDHRPRRERRCGRCAGGCRSSSRTRTRRSTRR